MQDCKEMISYSVSVRARGWELGSEVVMAIEHLAHLVIILWIGEESMMGRTAHYAYAADHYRRPTLFFSLTNQLTKP